MKKFNKILFVCIAVSAISFSSCKKPPVIDPIVGTWTLENTEVVFTTSNPTYAPIFNQIANGASSYLQLPKVLDFKSDGTGIYDGDKPFTYTKTNTQLTFIGISIGLPFVEDTFSVDYQMLDENKTLKMTLDLTEASKPALKLLIEYYLSMNGLPTSLADVILAAVSKTEGIATYNRNE